MRTVRDITSPVTVLFDENKPQEGHGRTSLRGGAISIIARAVNALVQVGSVIFLARLLSPQDYGLVTMVTAITGLAPLLVDLGTRDAIVQRDCITRSEISALFWMTVVLGGFFALLVAASGPVIARIYGEPRLTQIALVSSLMIVASALACQHHALLRRAMRFRSLAVTEVSSNVLGAGVAVGMAFYGLGYWALVFRPVVTAAFLAAGLWLQTRWIPERPTFNRNVKEMLKFGLNLIGFSITDFVGRSSDRVAVGYVYGATGLGYYQKALLVYDNLLDLTNSLHSVAAVSLSKMRHNLEELHRLWSKGILTVSFYAMPAFGLLAVTSQDLIVILLGNKWSSAGVLLSVLALRGMPHVVERTLGWLHVASGRADRWMRWGVISACIQLLALFVGLPYGPIGVATAYVICMYLLFVPTIAYAGKPLGIEARAVIKAAVRPLVGALGSAGIGFLLRYTVLADATRPIRLVVLGLVYLASYLVLAVGLFRVRTPLNVLLSLIRDALPARLGFLGKSKYLNGFTNA